MFGYGRIATFSTPSRRLLNRSYASTMSSSPKRWVMSGSGSKRPDWTVAMSRRMRSLPPGQSVVTMRWSPRPAANASYGISSLPE